MSAGRETGICCQAEGCAVRCVDKEQIRNPDGTFESCAPYGCEGAACKKACASIDDCAVGFVCDNEGKCVPRVEPEVEEGGCACHTSGHGGALSGWGALMVLLLLRRRSRR